jgi:hypothetical protein
MVKKLVLYAKYKSFDFRDHQIPQNFDLESLSIKKLLQLRDEYTQLYIRSQKCAMWRQLYREKFIDPSEWDLNHQFEIDENIRYNQNCEDFLTSIYEVLENKNKKYNHDIIIDLDDKNNIGTIDEIATIIDITNITDADIIDAEKLFDETFKNKKIIKLNKSDESLLPLNKRKFWYFYNEKMVNLQNPLIDEKQKIKILEYLMDKYQVKTIKQIMANFDSFYLPIIKTYLRFLNHFQNYDNLEKYVDKLVKDGFFDMIPTKILFHFINDLTIEQYIITELPKIFKFEPKEKNTIICEGGIDDREGCIDSFKEFLKRLILAILLSHHKNLDYLSKWLKINKFNAYYKNFEIALYTAVDYDDYEKIYLKDIHNKDYLEELEANYSYILTNYDNIIKDIPIEAFLLFDEPKDFLVLFYIFPKIVGFLIPDSEFDEEKFSDYNKDFYFTVNIKRKTGINSKAKTNMMKKYNWNYKQVIFATSLGYNIITGRLFNQFDRIINVNTISYLDIHVKKLYSLIANIENLLENTNMFLPLISAIIKLYPVDDI